ncbi:MAG: tetratricopeptide repeat protein [Myxococcota bacterium]
MSLVNDLLIEAERRRNGRERARTPRLDDLVPTRPRGRTRSARGASTVALVGLTAVAGLVVAGAAYLGTTLGPREQAGEHAGDPPSVAARREAAAAPIVAASVPAGTRVERPVHVESISLERLPGTTRIRIVADGRAPHTLEHDPASGRLELVLANAALTEPTGPIDLLDTPIRTLDLRAETPDLRLRFALDADVRTQTRWLDLDRGAALVLELQAAPLSRRSEPEPPGPTPSVAAAPTPLPADAAHEADAAATATVDSATPSADVALRSAGEPPAPPASIAPSDDAGPDEAEALLDSLASEAADQIHSPSLGDPAAMRIEPSQRERGREEQAERRAKREALLAAARHARQSKRLDEADARYGEIVLLAPDDPTPIAEWAEVLVLLGRLPDAIALLDSARERAPRDQTLLIAKARLLERTGDAAGAVDLLDRSGLALTEAPDVHTLAAAYQQRAGRHESAIERYEQILRRFPEEPRSWLGLGISLEAVGRRREARDVYRIALTVGELPGGARRWLTGRLATLGEEG